MPEIAHSSRILHTFRPLLATISSIGRKASAPSDRNPICPHPHHRVPVALLDRLIIRASHELRTPLTTILGRTQLMSTRMNRFGQTPENAEQLEHLFDLFYRTPQVEYSPIPGWGLGLSISKEIVRRHGGRIWAKISEGKDITFFVTLPLAEDIAEIR